eukprot:1105503-Rhodomonas_salina.1
MLRGKGLGRTTTLSSYANATPLTLLVAAYAVSVLSITCRQTASNALGQYQASHSMRCRVSGSSIARVGTGHRIAGVARSHRILHFSTGHRIALAWHVKKSYMSAGHGIAEA